jgi:hypothetical protein
MLAIASILGPSLGWAFTKAAERSWTAVFEIAKIVEAGGLVLKDKERRDPTRKAEKLAAIEKRRADRFRQAGSAIPDDMWRHGSNSEVMEALDDHFDVPAVQRMLLDDEDEDDRMVRWTRVGLRRRRAARWSTLIGKSLTFCGTVSVAIFATLGFLPATHAGLSTLIPSSSDHARPWVYFSKDPSVFYGSAEHAQLVGLGWFVVTTGFICALYRARVTAENVVSLRPQPVFEIFAAVAKLIAAYVSVSWEALLGREAVAVARPSVVRMAWMHDGLLTLVTASLLVTHMGIQSLRGDAAGEFLF